MQHAVRRLPKNTVEIEIKLSPEELVPHLEEAARRISEKTVTPGFRSGHAPYAVVAKKVGDARILEEALEVIVRTHYARVVLAEKLETLGSPRIDVLKLAPGNPLVFKATVALLPAVTKLADYREIKLERTPTTVSDEEVDRFVRELQKTQVRETRENRPVTNTDRVVIDLEISKGGVPIEGGTTKGHAVLMDETYYIPGFSEKLLGMIEGAEARFTLPFPKEHYNKALAGAPADFHVTVREIYARAAPALDDEFAKRVGKSTLAELRVLLRENLMREKIEKEEERVELELLGKIADHSTFEEIPDLLVNEEVGRMRHELERGVVEQGLEWSTYLTQIKKTEAELKLDFVPQAIRRIKTALVLRELASRENITVGDKEIDDELDRQAAHYEDDPATREKIYSPEYRDELAHILKNRKTIARLKELVVQ
ncbi:trigger factor [Candidatus Uhrbacteria bacterium]|nr:trigger factor [Candidatus Uhrbacteria bacterium]